MSKSQCCNFEGYCGTDDKFSFANKRNHPQYGICKCGIKNSIMKDVLEVIVDVTKDIVVLPLNFVIISNTSNYHIKYSFCTQNNYICKIKNNTNNNNNNNNSDNNNNNNNSNNNNNNNNQNNNNNNNR
ncbi:hypothetical protein PIROE2DRAFT_4085 [Piromyces sp. E2]|nr:hypothetical protein PIROE2DRAFT_4085 [Piromyces sp. E2]|eukprot:OUM68326.1 hypothetical protein PIROE2DRAFT_4085 [Piromyces sp. E2]